ncbi:cupin domain-containing protein [Rhodobacteraceae bacterium NNCM2]|nr:cupin domain-containing protein [Coraliihabitans acroporae]
MTREPTLLKHADWAKGPDFWRGSVEGERFGTDVTILFYATDEVGAGAMWHVHPYDEIFIIKEGRALYTVGDRKIVAEAGDIVFGPANVPHKFRNLGPGRFETNDIHLSPKWIQTDVPDPELEQAG